MRWNGGVVGADDTPYWFVEHATALGARFEDPIPQRIHVLTGAPRYPGVPGSPRAATVSAPRSSWSASR